MSTPKTPKNDRRGGGYGGKYVPKPISSPPMTQGLADLVGRRSIKNRANRQMNTPGLREEYNVPMSVRSAPAYMAYIKNKGYTGPDEFSDIVEKVKTKNLKKLNEEVAKKLRLDSSNIAPIPRNLFPDSEKKDGKKNPETYKTRDGHTMHVSTPSGAGGGAADGAGGGAGAGVDGEEKKHCDGKNPCGDDADPVQQGNEAGAQEPPGAPQAPANGGAVAPVSNPLFPQTENEQRAPGTGVGPSSYKAVPEFTGGAKTAGNGYGTGYRNTGTERGFVDGEGKQVTDESTLNQLVDRFKQGDKITDVPGVHTEEGNMRQKFGMESASNVIPSAEAQMASDIRFDMFDTVNPGFGEGVDNKLFLMQENRDAKIIHAGPMFAPGAYVGPVDGLTVAPWQLQRVMPEERVRAYGEKRRNTLDSISEMVITNGVKSTNLLGDDVGYPYAHSANELKRRKMSPFEPVIRTDMDWQHVKDPTGVQLNKLGFRRQTDAYRYPRHLESVSTGVGGPVYQRRRGLEVILQ